MRFFALLPTRNEANRYLRECLIWHSWIFDGIFVFDDRSTDNTVDIARDYATVEIRVQDPSFAQHEGQFRQQAWDAMVARFQPTERDWIFALDADEFLVSNEGLSQTTLLYCAAIQAENNHQDSVTIPIPEVFSTSANEVYIRTDGFWAGLAQPRLCKYRPNAQFSNKKMASGSLPTYANLAPADNNCSLNLLHFGYARAEDRYVKHERYKDVPGHNPTHVASILTKPKLQKWEGPIPL